MNDSDGRDDLSDQAEALEDSLGAAAAMAASFDTELSRVRDALAATKQDVVVLEYGLSKGLRRAFDGMKLSDAFDAIARSMIQATYSAAIRPVTNHVGALVSDGVTGLVEGILPFADGGSFSQGRVVPFANGGVVSGATAFPMRGGMGVMGEAGPEAILPLSRGADGKLGVRSEGSSMSKVVINVSTPDVQGFRRSQGQIASQMSRALSRGNRNK